MRIEGYAVVSEDGMIADASGLLPPPLIADADQRFFENGLNGVDVVVHGRNSGEQHPNSAKRHRIIVTRNIAALAPNPANPRAVLWNPAGASFEEALAALKAPVRSVGVLGGTDVFEYFLDRYTVFFLSRIAGIRLPGGRPVFSQIPAQTPEAVLTAHGLRDKGSELTDPAARLIISRWERMA
jgi:dihydrofolate reductase